MDRQDVLNLKKRYLVWLYKTTKEAFDRFERKFTQLEIDGDILKEIEKILKASYMPHEKKALERFVNDYRDYIAQKEKATIELKYKGKKANPEFIFLDAKLEAIESIIIKELGRKALEEIKGLYEKEMLERILKSTETLKS
jgi:predicted Ser/Thr protein kinase